MHSSLRSRWLAAIFASALSLVTTISFSADSPTTATPAPTTEPAPQFDKDGRKIITIEHIRNVMENHFAQIYSQPLRIEKDARLAQLIGAVSLTRIDGQPLTRHLMTLADRATIDPLVAQFGWEGLNARYKSLTPEQRTKWIGYGLDIAKVNGFPGETISPLLAALVSEPLNEKRIEDVVKVFTKVAEENDPATDFGRKTLDVAATSLASWSEQKVVVRLIGLLSRSPGFAKRMDIVLSKLPGRPATPANITQLQATLTQWLEKNPIPQAEKLAEYTGTSTFFGPPERIENPHDEKWKGEAELGNLRLPLLDFVVCVDATGSMAESNTFVFTYLEAVVKSLSTITTNLRAGAVYYRHENMPEVMVDCCKKNGKGPNDFLVRTIPLTANFAQLVAQMKLIVPDKNKGHDGGGGAYYSAMANAITVLGPKRDKDAAQVIAIVGDTFLTHGSDAKVLELAEKTGRAGYKVTYVVKNDGTARSVAAASTAVCNDTPIVYQPDLNKMQNNAADPLEGFEDTSFGKMVKRVICSFLPKAYQNRVDTLFNNAWKIILAQQHAAKARQSMS